MRCKIFALLLLASAAAEAATVQFNDDDLANAVLGMEIAGGNYDVVFGLATVSPDAGYGSWYDTFGNTGDEYAFIADLTAVLTSANALGFAYPDGSTGASLLAVFWDDPADICFESGSANAYATAAGAGGIWQATSFYCAPMSNEFFSSPYFKSSAVPVPAAVWLFASALAGLGWWRRKQSF